MTPAHLAGRLSACVLAVAMPRAEGGQGSPLPRLDYWRRYPIRASQSGPAGNQYRPVFRTPLRPRLNTE